MNLETPEDFTGYKLSLFVLNMLAPGLGRLDFFFFLFHWFLFCVCVCACVEKVKNEK